jgi:hypothetical protein
VALVDVPRRVDVGAGVALHPQLREVVLGAVRHGVLEPHHGARHRPLRERRQVRHVRVRDVDDAPGAALPQQAPCRLGRGRAGVHRAGALAGRVARVRVAGRGERGRGGEDDDEERDEEQRGERRWRGHGCAPVTWQALGPELESGVLGSGLLSSSLETDGSLAYYSPAAFILWPLDHPPPAARTMATARDPGRPSRGPPDERRRHPCRCRVVLHQTTTVETAASRSGTAREMPPCTPKKEKEKEKLMGAVRHVAVYVYGSG